MGVPLYYKGYSIIPSPVTQSYRMGSIKDI